MFLFGQILKPQLIFVFFCHKEIFEFLTVLLLGGDWCVLQVIDIVYAGYIFWHRCFFFFFEGESFFQMQVALRCANFKIFKENFKLMLWRNVYPGFLGGNDLNWSVAPQTCPPVQTYTFVSWMNPRLLLTSIWKWNADLEGFFKAYINDDQSWLLYVLRKLKAPEWWTFESAELFKAAIS